ncbi:MAG: formate/nitrite transporter family protein [Janthinobacterium lividum]
MADAQNTMAPEQAEQLQETLQTAVSATPEPVMIHDIIRQDGERELQRSVGALAWSGLGAGLSMGFSFLMMAVIRACLPETPWRILVAGFGYTTGFMIVVLGRQQLFTESTLTAVLPVLTQRTLQSIWKMLRLWAVVLAANLVGTILFAWLLSTPGLFDPEITEALSGVANDLLTDPFWPMAIKSMLAGWLIALMVWLMPSAGQSRLLLVLIITYTVAIAHFSHLIAGSVEAAYLVVTGQIGPGDYLTHFFVPTFLGNTIGGTSLVALLNHAPVREELDGGKKAKR